MSHYYWYAGLDADGICKDLSYIPGVISSMNLVMLEFEDRTVIGKRYENGKWVEVNPEEPEKEGNPETE